MGSSYGDWPDITPDTRPDIQDCRRRGKGCAECSGRLRTIATPTKLATGAIEGAGLEEVTQRPLQVPIYSPVAFRKYTGSEDLREALADCVIKPVDLRTALVHLESSATTPTSNSALSEKNSNR